MDQSSAFGGRDEPLDLNKAAAIIILIEFVSVLGMMSAQATGQIPVIWPANGLLLGILLTSRSRLWPAYLLFGFLANLTGALLAALPADICIRLALVNLTETAVALVLMSRYLPGEKDLSHARELWRFSLFAVLLAPASAAVLNAGLRALFAGGIPIAILANSFLAHALGIITITPFVLAVRSRAFSQVVGPGGAWGTILAMVVLLGTTVLVFAQSRYPLLFLIFPPLVLVVVVAGFPGGTLAVFLSTLVSVGFTVADGLTHLMGFATQRERIIVVQVFGAVAAALVLVLSAILAERDRAEQLMQAAKDDLTRLAATDGLTGLANRRRFDEVLDEECRRAAREQTPVSLLLLDVDRFKAFNDQYGHQRGDECLRAIAAVMGQFGRRPGNLAARYGGEELALVLPATPEAVALQTAESLRAGIEALALPHISNARCGGVVTASIGVATADAQTGGYDPGALLQAADAMLYEAKRTGRNQAMSRAGTPADPTPPVLANEARRAATAEAYAAAAQRASAMLDEIAALAAKTLGTPIGLVSLVGKDEQVFVGRHGLAVQGTGRAASFCAHVIAGESPMVVPDATTDPRFRDNPLVTGVPGIRFYAGAPLVSSRDHDQLGALCVIDREARPPLDEAQKAQLATLAALAMQRLEQIAPAGA